MRPYTSGVLKIPSRQNLELTIGTGNSRLRSTSLLPSQSMNFSSCESVSGTTGRVIWNSATWSKTSSRNIFAFAPPSRQSSPAGAASTLTRFRSGWRLYSGSTRCCLRLIRDPQLELPLLSEAAPCAIAMVRRPITWSVCVLIGLVVHAVVNLLFLIDGDVEPSLHLMKTQLRKPPAMLCRTTKLVGPLRQLGHAVRRKNRATKKP